MISFRQPMLYAVPPTTNYTISSPGRTSFSFLSELRPVLRLSSMDRMNTFDAEFQQQKLILQTGYYGNWFSNSQNLWPSKTRAISQDCGDPLICPT